MTKTLTSFIADNRIAMKATMTDHNPNMDKSERMDHWHCQLRIPGHRMALVFSMGPALCREPTAADVLDCLASDASGLENARGFEDWCAEYGYDTDSRKAERTYRTIERQAASLKRFLGDERYQALLWNTERM
jgi:hypothetical protein